MSVSSFMVMCIDLYIIKFSITMHRCTDRSSHPYEIPSPNFFKKKSETCESMAKVVQVQSKSVLIIIIMIHVIIFINIINCSAFLSLVCFPSAYFCHCYYYAVLSFTKPKADPVWNFYGCIIGNFDFIICINYFVINMQCLQYVFYSLLSTKALGYVWPRGIKSIFRPKTIPRWDRPAPPPPPPRFLNFWICQ